MALVKKTKLAARASTARPKSPPEPEASAALRAARPKPVASRRQHTPAERIAAAAHEFAAGVTEAAAAAEELQRTTTQIAAAAEEAAGTAHESAAAITVIAANFVQSRDRAEDALRRTQSVQSAIADASVRIEASVIAVTANSARQLTSVDVVAGLEKQSNAINDVTAAVTDVADRTNLVALNAAIEAARAGDAGQSFTVIADEVRILAENSEGLASEIQTLVGSIGSEVRHIADRIREAATVASAEAEASLAVSRSLATIRDDIVVLVTGNQQILAAAVEADAAAKEAQRGAQSIAAAAEQQSAATAEIQRSVQQQAIALEECDKTALALSSQADQLLSATDIGAVAAELGAAGEELSAAVQELSNSAAEILIALDQISRGAQAQSAAAQESNAVMTQTERSAGLAKESAKTALTRVTAMEGLLTSGREAVSRLIDGVATARTETLNVIDRIGTLEHSAGSIEGMADRLGSLALQTTMLAVSGAVEAARPGSVGRGFAIVSNEIRALARSAGENADSVKDLIRGLKLQTAIVRRDLEQMTVVSESEIQKNRLILEQLALIAADVETIRQGNQEIQQASEDVLQAVGEVLKGTTQIAAAAEQASAAVMQAATASRQQARGAEDLAAAVEEIVQLADALEKGVA